MTKADVYYFNPTCELAVANGSFSYMAPLLLQEMENDLSILPFAFCNGSDFVITENVPSNEFLEKLKKVGFDLPEFRSFADLETFSEDTFDAINPWGWSPAAHFRLKKLKEKCIDAFKYSPVYEWNEEHKLLFERETSLNFLNEFLKENDQSGFIDESMTGKKVSSIEEVESLLINFNSLVIKAPLSSSGRGIQILRKSKLNTANMQWISGILKQQKYLIAESLLDKVIDLSIQFQIMPDSEIRYLGYSIFKTNSNGQYKSTFINADLKLILAEENTEEIIGMVEKTAQMIKKSLQKSIYAAFHRGFLGVDAMIFRKQNSLLMQPCIEINSRMNMGILAKYLEKKIHSDSQGKFELFYGLPGEYLKFEMHQSKTNPPVMRNGKLYSGFLSLTEPNRYSKFGAYISLVTAK